MSGGQGFDEQFNDGLFRTSLHASVHKRPTMWPRSVSEMRRFTDYSGQAQAHGSWETGHCDYMTRRPYAVPQSPSVLQAKALAQARARQKAAIAASAKKKAHMPAHR